MKRLIEEVNQFHFPNEPASLDELEATETRTGYHFPSDMREFFLACDGASLFSAKGAPYRILSVGEIQRVRTLLFGIDEPQYGPTSWYAICALHDGDYVAIDFDSGNADTRCYYDCFHEAFPDLEYCPRIADSFQQFLSRALRSRGTKYWL